MTKKKKRIFKPILLAILCLFSLVSFAGATSEVTITVKAPDSLPAVGEEFRVTVELSGNPGLCASQFTLSYDKSVVTCTNAETGELLNGMLAATNAKAADGAIVAAASTTPVSGDGELGAYTFQVLKQGDPAFKISKALLSGENGTTLLEIKESGSEQETSEEKDDGVQDSAEGTTGTGATGTDTTDTTEQTSSEDPVSDTDKTESSIPVTEKASAFSDVPNDFWAAGNIARAAEKKLVSGYEDGTFLPNQNVTRAEFVTMLWRLEGSPAATKEAGFSDVTADAWYAPQVNWAAEKGIVNGKSATEFDPDGAVTRQEAMTILFRHNGGQSDGEQMLTGIYDEQFTDSSSIAEWAKPAMYWAVYKGLVTGVTADTLVPDGNATRAQIAVILVRYADAFSI